MKKVFPPFHAADKFNLPLPFPFSFALAFGSHNEVGWAGNGLQGLPFTQTSLSSRLPHKPQREFRLTRMAGCAEQKSSV